MRFGAALAALGFALAADWTMANVPPLRGVVEGYYGRPWSGPARRDVIRFLAAHDLNAFVYGPKNDDWHRARWREPYPSELIADLADTAAVARRLRVRFVYALSPALDVCYACPDDFDAVTNKLQQVAGAGVRRFALFFDDAPEQLTHPEDVARYGGSDAAALARAQAELVNRTDHWLRRQRLGRIALMVPTDYAGNACHAYHEQLGRLLRRRMRVGWTGSGVFASQLTAAEARARRTCVGGRPVVLWDNFPVNDTVLSNSLHLGPLTGRDPELPRELGGYLLNPMTQPHASLVGIGTAAAWLADPRRYDPERAWQEILTTLDPAGGLAILAEQTRSSPITHPDYPDAATLTDRLATLTSTWDEPTWAPALDGLEAEYRRQAAAPDAIAATLGGTPLGAEIEPWVTELRQHTARGLEAARLLRALRPAIHDAVALDDGTAVRVRGRVLPPDDGLAATLGPEFATPPAAPDLGAYLACLGNLLGADIRLCPQHGLNVHGKRLAIVPFSATDIAIVTDRNVHDHVLALVADRYQVWLARRPTGVLSLIADATPITLAVDGGFDQLVPRPASGMVTLLARTAAGDTTALVVPVR